MNVVQLSGEYDGQAKLNATQKGTPVAKFQLKYEKTFQSGKTYPSWFNCEAWGELADKIASVQPGLVEITGELKQERWETQDGQKRNQVKITVNELQVLQTAEQATHDPYAKYAQQEQQQEFDDTDIPF